MLRSLEEGVPGPREILPAFKNQLELFVVDKENLIIYPQPL